MDDFVFGLLCAGLCLFLPLLAGAIVAFLSARAARSDAREARSMVDELKLEVGLLRRRIDRLGTGTGSSPAAPESMAASSLPPPAAQSSATPVGSAASLPPLQPPPSVPLATSPAETRTSALESAVSTLGVSLSTLGAGAPAGPPASGASQPASNESTPSSSGGGTTPLRTPAGAPAGVPIPMQPKALVPTEAANLGAFIERNAVWAFAGVGALGLVIAALFGLREAILAGWFGPVARFGAGAAVGLGAWLVAELLRWRKYDIPSAALTGAGSAILYGTLYAGHARWGLLGQGVTFALMVAITAVTMFAAWRRDSRFVAYLSLVGGYATPVLLSTGENKAVAFFGYLALVNLGLLLVARRRDWPDLVAFSGIATNLLFLGWVVAYRAPDQVPVGLLAAAIFAFGYLALVPRGAAGVAVVATAMGCGTWLLGALAMATPTDTFATDPRNAMPLPWDLGATPWVGLVYLTVGAVLLPLLTRRWLPARVVAGAVLGVGAAAYTFSWVAAGESRWDVAAIAGPGVALLALVAGGSAAGLPALLIAVVATLFASAVRAMPAGLLPWHILALLLGTLWVAYGRGKRAALPVAALLLPLVVYVDLTTRLANGEATSVLFALLPVYFMLAFVPFFRPRRGDLWGVLGAALVPVAAFWPLYQAWQHVLGEGFAGVLPILLGANTLLGCIAMLRLARAHLGDRESAILITVSLLAVAVAIPAQLERGWLTVGWAIEVALLAWAWRRVRHPLLVGAGTALAALVTVRLLLNPFALEYGNGAGLPLLNWTLYTWGIPLVAFLLAARWYEARWLQSGLRSVAVLLGFALINLEIAHTFAHDDQLSFRSERLAEEMTRSVAWGGYGLGLVLLGILRRSRSTRLFGLCFAVVGAGKVFLVDTWSLSGFARVGAYGGMAITLLAAAVAFAYLVRSDNQREAQPPEAP